MFWFFFYSSQVTEVKEKRFDFSQRKALRDSESGGADGTRTWNRKDMKKKKKEERNFFCARLYISSLCPIALSPHLNTSPVLLTRLFLPREQLTLLMHPRRHVDHQEIPQIRPANYTFSSSHTLTHTHTLQVNGNIPT